MREEMKINNDVIFLVLVMVTIHVSQTFYGDEVKQRSHISSAGFAMPRRQGEALRKAKSGTNFSVGVAQFHYQSFSFADPLVLKDAEKPEVQNTLLGILVKKT